LVLLLANVFALALALVVQANPLAPPPRWHIPETSDPVKAVTAIAMRQFPGWFDDSLTPRQMSETALHRPLYTTCGAVSLWAVDLLTEAGFKARLVMVMTRDKWNTTDNGHTFVEIRQAGRWVAYDIHRKLRWTDERGRGLSTVEWISRVPSGNYRIVPLLAPVNERVIRRQDLRYAQVPFVRASGLLWFPSQGARNRSFLRYSSDYRVLAPDVWEARFGERLRTRASR
jgi:hypothetical protein